MRAILSFTPRAQQMLYRALDVMGLPSATVRVTAVRDEHQRVRAWRLAAGDAEGPGDTVVRTAGGIRVLIEPGLVGLITGAEVDFREDAAGVSCFVVEGASALPLDPEARGRGGRP